MPSTVDPPAPARTRIALIHQLGRKLGWSGRTALFTFGALSHDDIVHGLAVDPNETRAALFARSCRALHIAGGRRHGAEGSAPVSVAWRNDGAVPSATIEGPGHVVPA